MSGIKQIKKQIVSIKSTQKITRAMEMVAASKMKKTQARLLASQLYAQRIHSAVYQVARGCTDYLHSYLIDKPITTVGLIIVATDKGLCGGLNTALIRKVLQQTQQWEASNIKIKLCLIGTKALPFFKSSNSCIVAANPHTSETPVVEDIIGSVRVMLQLYDTTEIDHLFLAHNSYINTMKQKPLLKQVIPLSNAFTQPKNKQEHRLDYLYEPSARQVVSGLMGRYVEFLVYQAVIENIACEQAARMMAMKSATDNASNLVDDLQLVYNKARQAAITQEISEIVAGSSAV